MIGAGEAGGELAGGDAQGEFAGAGVAEAAGAEGDVDAVGGFFDGAVVDDAAFGGDEVHGDGAAAGFGGDGTVDFDEGETVGVLDLEHVLEQPAGEAEHALVDEIHADGFEVGEAGFDGGDVEVIEGAVFKGHGDIGEVVGVRLDAGDGDGAAGEPGAVEFGEGGAAGDERADASRVAEHLVKGNGDEIGVDEGEIQPVGGGEGGGVEEDVPTPGVGALDPGEGVLDGGEVGLGGVGKEVVAAAFGLGEIFIDAGLVSAHAGRQDGQVGDGGAAGKGEFADAVDGVVIVEGEEVTAALAEGVGFAHQFEGAAGIGGEDDDVLGGVGMEEAQDGFAGAIDAPGGGCRGGVGGMRVAENAGAQHLVLGVDLALGVESAAGVVEVDLPGEVKAGVIAGAQVVQGPGGLVGRVMGKEGLIAGRGHGCIKPHLGGKGIREEGIEIRD